MDTINTFYPATGGVATRTMQPPVSQPASGVPPVTPEMQQYLQQIWMQKLRASAPAPTPAPVMRGRTAPVSAPREAFDPHRAQRISAEGRKLALDRLADSVAAQKLNASMATGANLKPTSVGGYWGGYQPDFERMAPAVASLYRPAASGFEQGGMAGSERSSMYADQIEQAMRARGLNPMTGQPIGTSAVQQY